MGLLTVMFTTLAIDSKLCQIGKYRLQYLPQIYDKTVFWFATFEENQTDFFSNKKTNFNLTRYGNKFHKYF